MAEERETTLGGAPAAAAPPPVPDGLVSSPPASSAATPRRRSVRRIVIPIVAVVVVIAAFVGGQAYLNGLRYVSTDNAEVDGQLVPVGALHAGEVEAINVQVGSQVHKGEALARVLLPSTATGPILQSSVGQIGVRESVVAPFDGVVAATPIGVGSTVQPGQGIVDLVDPSQLYVNANIDEAQVKRVRAGQQVDVHIDSLNETLPGQVQAIVPASAASFSLLPPENNTTGNFTKVTQLVPVKIAVADLSNQPLLLGTSVEVTIHVGATPNSNEQTGP